MADSYDWSSLIAPAIGAAASAYAAKQNSKAASNANNSYQSAMAPYVAQGQRAASLLGNEDITQLPGYQSGLDAGMLAINRNAAAKGGFNSGNRQKALTKYAIDYNAGKTAERQNSLASLLGIGGNAAMSAGNSAANAGIASNNSKMSGITSALDLASKYLTSKDSSGKTNAQNIGSGISDWWSNNYGDNAQFRNDTQGYNDWGFD